MASPSARSFALRYSPFTSSFAAHTRSTELELRECHFPDSDGMLKEIGSACRQLESLSLQGCRKITDTGLALLAQGLQEGHLQKFSMLRAWSPEQPPSAGGTWQGIADLLIHHRCGSRLTSLSLGMTATMPQRTRRHPGKVVHGRLPGKASLPPDCPTLFQSLVPFLTDSLLLEIANTCTNLRSLILTNISTVCTTFPLPPPPLSFTSCTEL